MLLVRLGIWYPASWECVFLLCELANLLGGVGFVHRLQNLSSVSPAQWRRGGRQAETFILQNPVCPKALTAPNCKIQRDDICGRCCWERLSESRWQDIIPGPSTWGIVGWPSSVTTVCDITGRGAFSLSDFLLILCPGMVIRPC